MPQDRPLLTTWPAVLDYVAAGHRARIDSRQVEPGDVFVALPGSTVHGSDFAPQALKRGAAAVVAAPGTLPATLSQQNCVVHDDPREALGALAEAHFGTSRQGLELIGVTGTNGKTTVVGLLEYALQRMGRRVGVIGTIANRWPGHEEPAALTTPGCWDLHACLSRMAADGVDTVCMEVSSHALAQRRTAGLRFSAAVLTNVSQDHLDYHRDMESYFAAKSTLFNPSHLTENGVRVINADDPYGRRLRTGFPGAWGYSLHSEEAQDPLLVEASVAGMDRKGIRLSCLWQGQQWVLPSPLVGQHNGANLMAAQATLLALGFGPADAAGLSDAPPVPGRLERVENAAGLDIFVDYAHTPDALENVLQALTALDGNRLLVVFGCGGDRDRTKRVPMGQAVARYADVAILTSDNPRHEDPGAIMADVRPGLADCPRVVEESDRKSAIALALQEMVPGDILVVTGKGHETYQDIGGVRVEFSDIRAICEQIQCN